MNISIERLADYPQLIPAVGEIRWKEWGHPPEPESLDWWVNVTKHESGTEKLPVTWVAVDNQGQALGAVGLAEFDIEERHDRTPWVIGMITAAEYRSQGIGAQLLAVLNAFASEHGYKQIWVATGGSAVGFYQKCGWEVTEVIERSNGDVATILSKRI